MYVQARRTLIAIISLPDTYRHNFSMSLATQGMYGDRRAAGRELAQLLQQYAGDPEVLVLALPRGGLPVASEVAQSLRAPLDVLVVRKLGLPWQPECAAGAIGPQGVIVR